MTPVITFLIGLVVITLGAELLLRGAAKIATLLGIRPIVIGLTVVSIGTSLPELAVGITAIDGGATGIVIGNIVGTNIVNILLILGLSAIIRPLPIQFRLIRFEMVVMIVSALLLLVLCLDGTLSLWDGLVMLAVGIAYLVVIIRRSRKEDAKLQAEYRAKYTPCSLRDRSCRSTWLKNIVFLIVGIAGTIWGANLLVSGAVSIARSIGLSEAIIGLTIIAVGTSAPELATTLVSTFRGERDVAIGNLLGSSITNILIILSTTVLFAPKGIMVDKHILWIDLPIAALVAIISYPILRSGDRMSRIEGIVFTSSYIVYILFLFYFRT